MSNKFLGLIGILLTTSTAFAGVSDTRPECKEKEDTIQEARAMREKFSSLHDLMNSKKVRELVAQCGAGKKPAEVELIKLVDDEMSRYQKGLVRADYSAAYRQSSKAVFKRSNGACSFDLEINKETFVRDKTKGKLDSFLVAQCRKDVEPELKAPEKTCQSLSNKDECLKDVAGRRAEKHFNCEDNWIGRSHVAPRMSTSDSQVSFTKLKHNAGNFDSYKEVAVSCADQNTGELSNAIDSEAEAKEAPVTNVAKPGKNAPKLEFVTGRAH